MVYSYTPVIPAFETLRQKDQHMFKTSLVYIPSRESIVKSCFRKTKGEGGGRWKGGGRRKRNSMKQKRDQNP